MNTTRCDLHLHSAASVGNDEWYTRFFGCPESYAEPLRQYELCKARGMTLVTLTDHDTIAGGLQLAGRPDFFLSEEITAVFPENGCVMHVLAWNITPAQHDDIQACRRDIYRLCEYLNRQGIAHGLAHPLLSPNWQLDAASFEKVLLLFPTLEGINGLTDRRIEPDLTTVLERLTPQVIQELSAKHGFAPYGRAPTVRRSPPARTTTFTAAAAPCTRRSRAPATRRLTSSRAAWPARGGWWGGRDTSTRWRCA